MCLLPCVSTHETVPRMCTSWHDCDMISKCVLEVLDSLTFELRFYKTWKMVSGPMSEEC